MDRWLRELAPAFAAQAEGPALDVACGQGQNALWLASLTPGRDVLGIDASATALERAGTRAAGTTARFELCELAPGTLPTGPWSTILVFHFLDRSLLGDLAEILAPGGLLAYKTHLAHSLRAPDARPKNPDHLLHPGELLGSFPMLVPLRYDEWADGDEAFAALLARRPLRHSL